ncbi:hypothetical protein [Acidovorax sp. ACV01]|uniref:hypothetical protein n=1 Tax=Acidovorax sp. ACV01 TaxID=2769311 RepID=UPI00177BC9DF|nr:hypothetical protein [Acidovorax sp. ACV01]MBD9395269.1 hypothetical protein [Acidovorax sp. ACV01]
MKVNLKRGILFGLLAATLIAALLAPKQEDTSLVLPAVRTKTEAPGREVITENGNRRSDDKQLVVLQIKPRGESAADGELSASLFEKVSWGDKEKKITSSTEAQIPIVPPLPAPPVQAPPLPFQVIGQYKEGGRSGVFLQHMNNNYVIYAGDTIFEDYKVESIDESSVKFRFLPLDQIQQLPVGSVSN